MINLKKLIKENEEQQKSFSTHAKKNFLEIVSTYNKYQEMMDRKSDITQVAETLGAITEAATQLAISEGDDWFDKHTVKRNMGELKKLGGQFGKISKESAQLDQRLTGLYEDMGHILSRYYKIGDITEDEMKSRLGMTNEGKLNEDGTYDKLTNTIHKNLNDMMKYIAKTDKRSAKELHDTIFQKYVDWDEKYSLGESKTNEGAERETYKVVGDGKTIDTDLKKSTAVKLAAKKKGWKIVKESTITEISKSSGINDVIAHFAKEAGYSSSAKLGISQYTAVLKKSHEFLYGSKNEGAPLKEGADHILLQSIDMMIDSYRGHFIPKDPMDFFGDIEFNTNEWKQIAKKANPKDKKIIASVLKGMNESTPSSSSRKINVDNDKRKALNIDGSRSRPSRNSGGGGGGRITGPRI